MMNDKLTKLLIISSLSIGATSNLGTIILKCKIKKDTYIKNKLC